MIAKTDAFQNARMQIAKRLLLLKGEDMQLLFNRANAVRWKFMGDDVFIRGIIEFSNICSNNCAYCGIRSANHKVRRYAMSAEEILQSARMLARSGITTVVLQSGEPPSLGDNELAKLIGKIKAETPLAVTVSAGSRPRDVYKLWRDCGMDRYLIRFETSDPALYARMHPESTLAARLENIRTLQELSVQTGSGFLIGLPGETLDTLAANILLCRSLDLDMIGIGPFIPHEGTPLAQEANVYAKEPDMFFKALAVLRLFNPSAHIPATTAYDAVFPGQGRNLALQRGANVFMPNNTPARHRMDYLLYPGKPCVDESADQCNQCVHRRIAALGRNIGQGPGHSKKMHAKTPKIFSKQPLYYRTTRLNSE